MRAGLGPDLYDDGGDEGASSTIDGSRIPQSRGSGLVHLGRNRRSVRPAFEFAGVGDWVWDLLTRGRGAAVGGLPCRSPAGHDCRLRLHSPFRL